MSEPRATILARELRQAEHEIRTIALVEWGWPPSSPRYQALARWAGVLREAADQIAALRALEAPAETAETVARPAKAEADNATLRAVLSEMTEDLEARWDMNDPRTNPGIKHHVQQARAALARVPAPRETEQEGKGMSDEFDWDAATVRVSVPVHHTAMTTVQEFDVPIKVLRQLLDGTDSLPLATLDQAAVDRAHAAASRAREAARRETAEE